MDKPLNLDLVLLQRSQDEFRKDHVGRDGRGRNKQKVPKTWKKLGIPEKMQRFKIGGVGRSLNTDTTRVELVFCFVANRQYHSPLEGGENCGGIGKIPSTPSS